LFIAKVVKGWLEAAGVKTLYIEPGSLWENAYSESFNSRFRGELLDREVFSSVLEAKVLAGDYREHYNHQRPHSALGYQRPAEFKTLYEASKEDMNLTKELELTLVLS
jgi:transposase InsO family protein